MGEQEMGIEVMNLHSFLAEVSERIKMEWRVNNLDGSVRYDHWTDEHDGIVSEHIYKWFHEDVDLLMALVENDLRERLGMNIKVQNEIVWYSCRSCGNVVEPELWIESVDMCQECWHRQNINNENKK